MHRCSIELLLLRMSGSEKPLMGVLLSSVPPIPETFLRNDKRNFHENPNSVIHVCVFPRIGTFRISGDVVE